MSEQPKILAFAGSARRDSLNRALAGLLAGAVRAEGMACTVLELSDYPLPLYDGDLEAAEGLPANVHTLRQIFMAHQGLLIASPEYNSSISPLLKNVIDWVSRSPGGEPGLAPYEGKVAALGAASPGALGGLRGLVTLRSILGNIGVTVLPQQVALPHADRFLPGELDGLEPAQARRVAALAAALASTVSRLHPAD
jgi:NAD(P)H-dependent FMN reductase